jgi:hypothetical protein
MPVSISRKANLGLDPAGAEKFPSRKAGGQATKGTRWMPWRQEAMKDVVSCDKLRGAASGRRYVDLRMGKPPPGHAGGAFF